MKTITIGDNDGNPRYSLCIGHVSLKEYKKAFKAEGWAVSKIKLVYYDYWVETPRGKWGKSCPTFKAAVPVTVTEW